MHSSVPYQSMQQQRSVCCQQDSLCISSTMLCIAHFHISSCNPEYHLAYPYGQIQFMQQSKVKSIHATE